jgi:hypothetical protein
MVSLKIYGNLCRRMIEVLGPQKFRHLSVSKEMAILQIHRRHLDSGEVSFGDNYKQYCYHGILTSLIKHPVIMKRQMYPASVSCMKTPDPTPTINQQTLASLRFTVVPHPPQSLDLTPQDYAIRQYDRPITLLWIPHNKLQAVL